MSASMNPSLAAVLILAISSAPIGVFLMLRRMSLAGDVMSHAILPGVGLAYLIGGTTLISTLIGGIAAGLAVALLAGFLSRRTLLKEDASLSVFYLVSLSLGVVLLQSQGADEEIIHSLFGHGEDVSRAQLLLAAITATLTLPGLAVIWRPLVAECLDPGFLRSVKGRGGIAHHAFLVLAVLNLVAGFHIMGALLAVALMMLPAIAARFWCRGIDALCLTAMALAAITGCAGLFAAHLFHIETGPAITLVGGAIVFASALAGPEAPLRKAKANRSHRTG